MEGIVSNQSYVDMAHRDSSTNSKAPSGDFDYSKKLNSLSLQDDRNDSGLDSIGYFSGECIVSLEESAKEEMKAPVSKPDVDSDSSQPSNLGSLELANSISKLNIDNSSDRFDSGIAEEQETPAEVCSTPSQFFSVAQIEEIFRGDEDGDNHLHLSIIHCLQGVTMQIISLAPDAEWLNQANNLRQTPLHIAVITRQAAVVRRLICAGASVDVRDQMGNTPLHTACMFGYEDIVRLFLTPVRYEETYQNHFAAPTQTIPQDLDSRNYEGLTCLHLAAIGNHINVMTLLLNSGANVNAAEGKNGRTVLHMAADWGHSDMLTFLLKMNETNINASTYGGLTPIHLAFGRQNGDAVRILFLNGASCETLSLSDDSDMENSDEESFDSSANCLMSSSCMQHPYLQTCR